MGFKIDSRVPSYLREDSRMGFKIDSRMGFKNDPRIPRYIREDSSFNIDSRMWFLISRMATKLVTGPVWEDYAV